MTDSCSITIDVESDNGEIMTFCIRRRRATATRRDATDGRNRKLSDAARQTDPLNLSWLSLFLLTWSVCIFVSASISLSLYYPFSVCLSFISRSTYLSLCLLHLNGHAQTLFRLFWSFQEKQF